MPKSWVGQTIAGARPQKPPPLGSRPAAVSPWGMPITAAPARPPAVTSWLPAGMQPTQPTTPAISPWGALKTAGGALGQPLKTIGSTLGTLGQGIAAGGQAYATAKSTMNKFFLDHGLTQEEINAEAFKGGQPALDELYFALQAQDKLLTGIGGPTGGTTTGATTLDPRLSDPTKYPDIEPQKGMRWEWQGDPVAGMGQWVPSWIPYQETQQPKNWIEYQMQQYGGTTPGEPVYPGAPEWLARVSPELETGQQLQQGAIPGQIGKQQFGQLTAPQQKMYQDYVTWLGQSWEEYLNQMQQAAPPGGGGMQLQYAK